MNLQDSMLLARINDKIFDACFFWLLVFCAFSKTRKGVKWGVVLMFLLSGGGSCCSVALDAGRLRHASCCFLFAWARERQKNILGKSQIGTVLYCTRTASNQVPVGPKNMKNFENSTRILIPPTVFTLSINAAHDTE